MGRLARSLNENRAHDEAIEKREKGVREFWRRAEEAEKAAATARGE